MQKVQSSTPPGKREPLALLAEPIADRLREILLPEIAEILREPAESAPALLDRRQLASKLSICLDTLDKLRKAGLPEIRVGDAPRFELNIVLEWLRQREEER